MKKTGCIYVLLIFFGLQTVFAQNGRISGKITSDSEEDLIGVNVIIDGTTTGVSSDIDGNYSIEVPAGSVTLMFSYTGFETRRETVSVNTGGSVVLNVALKEKVTQLNKLVVSGSRYEKRLAEEQVSMEIIEPAAIQAISATGIDDAIERVPGVTILDGQVNIRGGAGYSYGAGTRVLLLSDDIPVLQADAGFPNWSFVPIENLAQVEIIKGASSALYGSSAMNGIINFRTAYAGSEPFTQLSVFGTVFNNPRDNIDSLGNEKAWWNNDTIGDASPNVQPYEAGFSLAHRQKFGQLDFVSGAYVLSSSTHRYGDYDHRGRLNLNLRYRPTKMEGWSFQLNTNVQFGQSSSFFLWNGDGADAYLPWSSIGEPTTTKSLRFIIDPIINYFDTKGNRHKFLGRYYKINNDNTNDQGNFSDFFYAEYQYQREIQKIAMVVTTGLVGTYNSVRAPLYGDTLSGRNVAMYLQADKKFFNKLSISFGARMESNKISMTDPETRVVFRSGLNYQAADFTYIRTSWGQGYRFPTIAEKFITTSLGDLAGIFPNLNLVSERGWNYEIGIKQGFRLGELEGFADMSFFYMEYSDMMEFTFFQPAMPPPLVGFKSQNIGDTRIYGTEIVLGGKGEMFGLPTTFFAGYTYTSPKFQDFTDEIAAGSTSDENILKYRFKHRLTADVESSFKSIYFGVSLQYFSNMEAIDQVFENIIPDLEPYRAENDGGDAIFDLRAGYTLKEKTRIGFICKNVANREYALRPGRIDAPRSYTLRIDHTF